MGVGPIKRRLCGVGLARRVIARDASHEGIQINGRMLQDVLQIDAVEIFTEVDRAQDRYELKSWMDSRMFFEMHRHRYRSQRRAQVTKVTGCGWYDNIKKSEGYYYY